MSGYFDYVYAADLEIYLPLWDPALQPNALFRINSGLFPVVLVMNENSSTLTSIKKMESQL